MPLLDFKWEGQTRSIFFRERKKKEKASADVNTHQKTSTTWKVLVTSVSHKRSKERRCVRLGSLLSSKGWMHVNDIYENQQGFVFSLSFCRRFSLSGRDLMRQEATNFLFRFETSVTFCWYSVLRGIFDATEVTNFFVRLRDENILYRENFLTSNVDFEGKIIQIIGKNIICWEYNVFQASFNIINFVFQF